MECWSAVLPQPSLHHSITPLLHYMILAHEMFVVAFVNNDNTGVHSRGNS